MTTITNKYKPIIALIIKIDVNNLCFQDFFFAKDLNQLKSIEMNERSLYAKRMFKL
jgi:hypothetical protein